MKKKARTDSLEGKLSSMGSALKRIPAPKELTKEQALYWEKIIDARCAETWNQIDLVHAANLSKIFVLVDLAHQEILTDGMTLKSDRGTPVDNPAFSRLEKLTRLIKPICSQLKIHAEATVGRSEDLVKGNKSGKKASKTISKTSSLIARPH